MSEATEPRVAVLRSRMATVQVALDRGANAFAFDVEQESQLLEVLHCEPGFAEGLGSPTRSGVPLLAPFPNRVRDAAFEWHRETWALDEAHVRRDAHGHAIHGLVLDRPFRLVDAGRRHVTARFSLSEDAPEAAACWPADFSLEVTWSLKGARLRCELSITNTDARGRVLPWGLGAHPWLRLPVGRESGGEGAPGGRHRVQVPARQRWTLDAEMLPTGELEVLEGDLRLEHGRSLDGLELDDALCDLQRDRRGVAVSRLVDDEAGVGIDVSQSERMRELVVYTPPEGHALCIEPYTCTTDAVHLERMGFDAGLGALEPGGRAEAWFEISLVSV